MSEQATTPHTTRRWTVYTAWYDAPRADQAPDARSASAVALGGPRLTRRTRQRDQRVKAGERNSFQASSVEEVREKIATRGIDARAHNLIVLAEHFTESSHTTDETGSFR